MKGLGLNSSTSVRTNRYESQTDYLNSSISSRKCIYIYINAYKTSAFLFSLLTIVSIRVTFDPVNWLSKIFEMST